MHTWKEKNKSVSIVFHCIYFFFNFSVRHLKSSIWNVQDWLCLSHHFCMSKSFCIKFNLCQLPHVMTLGTPWVTLSNRQSPCVWTGALAINSVKQKFELKCTLTFVIAQYVYTDFCKINRKWKRKRRGNICKDNSVVRH